MEQGTRKATDILIEIESKVNTLLDTIRAQDLNIKILSNKLNDVMGRLEKQQAAPTKIVVEAVQTKPSTPFPSLLVGDLEKNIPVVAEHNLPVTDMPHGFRRSSRPETFAGDNAYLPHGEEIRMPVQIPKVTGRQGANMPPPGRDSESSVVNAMPPPMENKRAGKNVLAPPNPHGMPLAPINTITKQSQEESHQSIRPQSTAGNIPVMQRCVDRNSKSIFLADVEIVDLSSGEIIFRTRTNGVGKWMASLGVGGYRVTISKCAAMNKKKVEAVQDIQVDGTQSPLELPMLIIK